MHSSSLRGKILVVTICCIVRLK